MEPSQPSSADSMHPSPMNALELIMATYEEIDTDEEIEPSEGFKSSESTGPGHDGSTPSSPSTMEPSQPFSVDSVHSPLMDALESMRETCESIDRVEQIDPLISLVENQVDTMEGQSQAGSSSSAGWENACSEILPKILNLAKTLKQYSQQMPGKGGNLRDAVGTIVEAIDQLKRAKNNGFWSPTTAALQIEKTNQQLRDEMYSLYLSSLQLNWDKDVFLSHSGAQKNLVRHLHRDLTRERVLCFFDEDSSSLPLAEKFPDLIFKAAEACKIAVVVISKEFVRSKWPMQELSAFVEAMKQGKNANLKLLPIFFKITPKELSHMTKDSLEWQNLNVSDDKRGKWQAALQAVRPINGLTLEEKGNEVDLIDEVVKRICSILRGIKPPIQLEFNPVGIQKQVLDVEKLLDMKGSEPALAVILYGLGGIGKTTLAAYVVQSLDWSYTDFKFCMVEIDNKTAVKESHIIILQKKILRLLGGAQIDEGDTINERRHKIKEALEKKPCLLFIDNVLDKSYIKDLLPQNLFPFKKNTKLRIIITSRGKNLKADLDERRIIWKEYEVRGLSEADSKYLLQEKIMQSQVLEETYSFEDEQRMINDVAAECRGVPLLLYVFGKNLRVRRNKDNYGQALNALKEGNLSGYKDEDLHKTLMFVYDQISDVEKEAFLDVCVYFHGWEWDLVMDIFYCGQLEDLHDRALVSKSSSDEVNVHDMLRFMGMKEARFTRFSNHKELSKALQNNLDGFDKNKVKGISLFNDNHLTTIQSSDLEAMHKSLRVLMLGDWVALGGPPCQQAFTQLRYLHVGDIAAFPFTDPSNLNNLRVFLNRSKPGINFFNNQVHAQFASNLKRIYHGVPHVECEEVHFPSCLVNLDLKRFKNLPKDMGHLTALESLVLDRSDVERLPQGFDKLKELKHLSMAYCSKLECLPEGFGKLKKLEHLSMDNCSELECLPQGFDELKKLKHLSMDHCLKLKCLPEDLGKLCSLEVLSIKGCKNLQKLPQIGELRIQSLNLHSLDHVHELPTCFGKMPLLKYLSLESCLSLVSLPESFVHLKMLESLKIIKCTKLSALPKDFGLLGCLEEMVLDGCRLLKELPQGFGALPALKTFKMRWCCQSFLNLPEDFTKLTSLEELSLDNMVSLSCIPGGLGKLAKLRFLHVRFLPKLKTMADDLENLAKLERVSIIKCYELNGVMMEKILKLPNCYMANIYDSTKLKEKWERMQGETEHPIVVVTGEKLGDKERVRAIMVALLHGKCMEVNKASHQLMERSSLLVGLEEGTSATVALIMLPIHMKFYQYGTLQRFVDMAEERAKTKGWGKLQIVCARKVELDSERRTPTQEEEREEEEGIRQILMSVPKGSWAIPSSECKRLKVLTYCGSPNECNDKLSFFMAKVGVDIEGRQVFFTEEEFRGKSENKHQNSIQNFIESISVYGQSQCVAGKSKTGEFVEALKDNRIDHLLIHEDNISREVLVDDLHGKAICFIICDLKILECVELQQIYKDIQQKDSNSNFIWIWIPTSLAEDCGHGTYTKLIQPMPWAIIPSPHLVKVKRVDRPYFVVLETNGQIANRDAWPLLMGWGAKSYPFTENIIPESFCIPESISSVKTKSGLEFLLHGLHGMSIAKREPMTTNRTYLYAAHPVDNLMTKSQIERLAQNYAILYVGSFYEMEISSKIEDLKKSYEDARQNMCCPSLSFSNMITFWYRCKYLVKLKKQSNRRMENLRGLAQKLYRYFGTQYSKPLVLLKDNDSTVHFEV